MDYMKGVVVEAPGRAVIRDDIPIPEPGAYEVLCKVHACGVCSGTDFQVINGTLGEEAGFQGYPTVLGHEGAGEIVALGSKVRHLRIGDRCIHPNLRPDVGNGYKKTYGGMAQYGLGADFQAMVEDGVCAPDSLPFSGKFHTFPSDIPYSDAALLLSLSECHSAARNFGAKPGDRVLFYGAGPMGTGLALFMKLLGASHITVVDAIPARLENARRVAHADRTINFQEQPVQEVLKDETFDLVVDAVGSSEILINGSRFLRLGGKMCSLGVLKKQDSKVAVTLMKNNTMLHMLTQPSGEYAAMDETIRYILSGEVRPGDFYSHVVPFTELDRALELVRSREAMKVVLSFEDD